MHTGGAIVLVTKLISDTLSETTYENVGNSKILRWNVNGNYPIGKKININFNTGLFLRVDKRAIQWPVLQQPGHTDQHLC